MGVDTRKEIAAAEGALSRFNSELRDVQKQIESLQNRRVDLNTSITKAKCKIARLEQEVAS